MAASVFLEAYMNGTIIGRKNEVKQLQELLHSPEPEFLVIYGQRRIGKTYLIREFFSQENCLYFEATGLKDGSMIQQLEAFTNAFAKAFNLIIYNSRVTGSYYYRSC